MYARKGRGRRPESCGGTRRGPDRYLPASGDGFRLYGSGASGSGLRESPAQPALFPEPEPYVAGRRR